MHPKLSLFGKTDSYSQLSNSLQLILINFLNLRHLKKRRFLSETKTGIKEKSPTLLLLGGEEFQCPLQEALHENYFVENLRLQTLETLNSNSFIQKSPTTERLQK